MTPADLLSTLRATLEDIDAALFAIPDDQCATARSILTERAADIRKVLSLPSAGGG
jgi:hypothetical protein